MIAALVVAVVVVAPPPEATPLSLGEAAPYAGVLVPHLEAQHLMRCPDKRRKLTEKVLALSGELAEAEKRIARDLVAHAEALRQLRDQHAGEVAELRELATAEVRLPAVPWYEHPAFVAPTSAVAGALVVVVVVLLVR